LSNRIITLLFYPLVFAQDIRLAPNLIIIPSEVVR